MGWWEFFARISCCGIWHGFVGIIGCRFFARIFGCGAFCGFCSGQCRFGVRIFLQIFWALSHRKSSEDPVREAFLHSTSPHSFWQDTADLLRVSGCRCTLWRTCSLCVDGFWQRRRSCSLNMCLVLAPRMMQHQDGPAAQREVPKQIC